MTLSTAITAARSRFHSSVSIPEFATKRTHHHIILTERDKVTIAAIRIVLALSTFLVFFGDPAASDRPVTITSPSYSVLVVYLLYSMALSVLAVRRKRIQRFERWAPWLDAVCYFALALLSPGLHGIALLGFYFAIFVAALYRGAESGIWVMWAVSVGVFCTQGFSFPLPAWSLGGFTLHPLYLLLPGYLIAQWGGNIRRLGQRLALFQEVTGQANAQLDMQGVTRLLTRRVQDLYTAEVCWFIPSQRCAPQYALLPRPCLGPHEMQSQAQIDRLARRLDLLPLENVVVVCGASHRWKWWCPWARCRAYDARRHRSLTDSPAVSTDWLTLEKDQSAAVVPVHYQGEVVAYLYLVVQQRHALHVSDIDFLTQLGGAVVLILENIQLVANTAAEERRRIARDLHDKAVQSYLALQIGLTALHERLAAGAVDVRSDLEHLLEFASAGVTDIRGYVQGLRNGHESVGDLLPAVEGFAATFAKAAGITVRVEAETEVRISGRLATEAFHMVAEGLSNVKRHTNAGQAVVRLACREDNLILRIENDQSQSWMSFTPRSITERAAELGGHVRVERCGAERTAVTVTVPL